MEENYVVFRIEDYTKIVNTLEEILYILKQSVKRIHEIKV